MDLAVVAVFKVLLPLLSIGAEWLQAGTAPGVALVAKWFVFRAVGRRLLLAGLRRIVQPPHTARAILGLADESLIRVRELGFADVAMGVLGIGSLLQPGWRLGAALAGGVFHGLAGITHATQGHRNRLENVAMVSNLAVGAVLVAAFIAAV